MSRGGGSPEQPLPRVSVVIPCLNAGKAFDEQLASLAAQDYAGPWEVIVADNGSTDGSSDRAKAWADRLPDLLVVDASGRRGVSHARNVGARAAKGEVILICDADDRVTPTWVSTMAQAILAGNDLVGGRLDVGGLNPDHPPSSKELGDWNDFLPCATGANCGFSARVFKTLGGYDEGYIGGADDAEFSWRGQLAGFRLGFVPEAVVHYRLRSDPRGLARQYFYYGRAQPRLYRQFGADGMPRSSVRQALKSYGALAKHLPDLLSDQSHRRFWIKTVALRCGRILGSIEQRVLYL